jgi:hypothetical protein
MEVVIQGVTTSIVIVAMIAGMRIADKTADMRIAATTAAIERIVGMKIEATDETTNVVTNVATVAEMNMLETDMLDGTIATVTVLEVVHLEVTTVNVTSALTGKHLDLGILPPLARATGSLHLDLRVEMPMVALEITEQYAE